MDPHYDGVIFQTHAAEMIRRVRASFPAFRVLDVRPSAEFASGHIPDALSSSAEQLELALPQGLDVGNEIFVIGAAVGDPAIRQASLALMSHGARRIVELPGGMSEWRNGGGKTEIGTQRAA